MMNVVTTLMKQKSPSTHSEIAQTRIASSHDSMQRPRRSCMRINGALEVASAGTLDVLDFECVVRVVLSVHCAARRM